VGQLPEALQKDAEMYAGCVAGAIQKDDYLNMVTAQGFERMQVQKIKPIVIPDDILSKYLTTDELTEFKSGQTGIFSITVYAEKPLEQSNCCAPGCCN
jgi:hypothetical protein